MLDDTGLRMMRLAGAGFCCSQILVLLALEDMDRENPDLVRAMAGLCNGLGDCSGHCGVLTGACCLLGLYAAKGAPDEEPDDRLPLLLSELTDWFRETAQAEFGGISCAQINGGECGRPHPERCGGLVARTYARTLEILADNGLDPSQGRGNAGA
jgi:hypothetical protein